MAPGSAAWVGGGGSIWFGALGLFDLAIRSETPWKLPKADSKALAAAADIQWPGQDAVATRSINVDCGSSAGSRRIGVFDPQVHN